MEKHQHTSTEGKEGKQQHTPGQWIMNTTKKFMAHAVNGLAITNDKGVLIAYVSHDLTDKDIDEYVANAELIASAPTLKAESESLKLEVERLKRNKETAMLLALEFGYKQCEKGENLNGAFLNYKKLTEQK